MVPDHRPQLRPPYPRVQAAPRNAALTLALAEQGRPVEAGKIFAALAIDAGSEAPEASPHNGFVIELYAGIDTLPPQQRAVMLADLAAGGTADTADLTAELESTRNSIYVSRTNGRKALCEARSGTPSRSASNFPARVQPLGVEAAAQP